jgi:hypothetical protein
MMEKPIIMSTPMVRAILEGRKSQTRRICKPQPYSDLDSRLQPIAKGLLLDVLKNVKFKIGDILWVRETWNMTVQGSFYYRADMDEKGDVWKPSIFMPHVACRLRLEVTNIRVEKLNDISKEDAISEGLEWGLHTILNRPRFKNYYGETGAWYHDPIDSYKSLWESINGKGSWNKNPWVWCISFKKIWTIYENYRMNNPNYNWNKEIAEMEKFFAAVTLPEKVRLNSLSMIVDTHLFVNSHMNMIKAHNGETRFMPYLTRLQEVKKILENEK